MLILLETEYGNEIAINPECVAAISDWPKGVNGDPLASIRFCSGSQLTVLGTVKHLQEKLNSFQEERK